MVYAVSDLHGYPLERFQKLLAFADFSDDDYLFIIGDIIDRNEDGGVPLLLWIMEQPNIELILGNHEAMLMACDFLFDEITEESVRNLNKAKTEALSIYLLNGGENTIKGLKKLSPENRGYVLEFLLDCPLYETVSAGNNDYILVHSGFTNFSPDRKLSDYTADELLWTRPLISDNYFDDIITVFGHTPTKYYGAQYAGKIIRTKTWINIDAGAGSGEEPVLFRLDDGAEFRLNKND